MITIYDCKISVEWTGVASDGTEINSKVTIPEVSHEITLDRLSDYTASHPRPSLARFLVDSFLMRQYQWSESGSSNPATAALYALARERLPVALEAKFAEFPVAITEKHGKDLTVSGAPSRTGTPAPTSVPVTASGSTAPSVPAPAEPATAAKTALNTSKIVKEATFMAAADDLFGLLTDQQRIPSWTRARAEVRRLTMSKTWSETIIWNVQSVAKADTPYSLFDGGVKGRYISLMPGKEIVQTWALTSPTWPSGTYFSSGVL